MASATTGCRLGLSPFCMPAAAWKWEIAARACSMVAMALPSSHVPIIFTLCLVEYTWSVLISKMLDY